MAIDPYRVEENEHGLVRLFTTDMEPEVDAAITPQNVHKLLGDEVSLNAEKAEIFPSKVIAGLGLSRYLVDGYGVADAELAGKTAALDALTGLIVLIPSSAFVARPQVLNPNPALRFIGIYREERGKPGGQPRKPETAKGQIVHPSAPVHDPAPRARHHSWIIALGALIIAAALVLYLAF